MNPTQEYVLWLQDITPDSSGLSGGKATNLGELLKNGFPVPDGFVVTTLVFDRFLEANNLGSNHIPKQLENALIPADCAEAIRSAIMVLGDVPLAVRSSGVMEDLSNASFAGQYETVLNVRGIDDVLAAVRKCWTSAFSQRVSAYTSSMGLQPSLRLAVLVQVLVPAEAAGVAFTANPITGDRQEVTISAVCGFGEQLVSGKTTSDEWLVRGDKATCITAPENALIANEVLVVADVAKQVEKHFGSPQDVEWAIAGGKVFVLQARPITTMLRQIPKQMPKVEPPSGYWERETQHFAKPVSPMYYSYTSQMMADAFKKAFDDIGAPIGGIEAKRIGGWLYTRILSLGGRARSPPPAWLVPVLIRLVPQIRSRIKKAVQWVRSDRAGQSAKLWYEEWKPELISRSNSLRDADLASLSDSALDDHLEAVLDYVRLGYEVHFRHLGLAQLFTLADLVLTCNQLLGWDEAHAMNLLHGLSEKSSEPSRRLADLVKMAKKRPRIQDVINRLDEDTVRSIMGVDSEFTKEFESYLREFGSRALSYEVIEPTLGEMPTFILKLVRDQLIQGYDPAAKAEELEKMRENTETEAFAKLTARPEGDRQHFREVLDRARFAYPVREDNVFYTLNMGDGLIRQALLELGRRLVQRSVIARYDDVFFLELKEARNALRAGGDLHEVIIRRREEMAWAERNVGPISYGKKPELPPLPHGLPEEMHYLMERILWAMQRIGTPRENMTDAKTGRTIRGIAASSGKYTGTARIIISESQFGKLQPGDVLICPTTSSAWSVLFSNLGALVTDIGSVLSHPAILAREFGIPAVVATGKATKLVRDGQRVTVDGISGAVEIHET